MMRRFATIGAASAPPPSVLTPVAPALWAPLAAAHTPIRCYHQNQNHSGRRGQQQGNSQGGGGGQQHNRSYGNNQSSGYGNSDNFQSGNNNYNNSNNHHNQRGNYNKNNNNNNNNNNGGNYRNHNGGHQHQQRQHNQHNSGGYQNQNQHGNAGHQSGHGYNNNNRSFQNQQGSGGGQQHHSRQQYQQRNNNNNNNNNGDNNNNLPARHQHQHQPSASSQHVAKDNSHQSSQQQQRSSAPAAAPEHAAMMGTTSAPFRHINIKDRAPIGGALDIQTLLSPSSSSASATAADESKTSQSIRRVVGRVPTAHHCVAVLIDTEAVSAEDFVTYVLPTLRTRCGPLTAEFAGNATRALRLAFPTAPADIPMELTSPLTSATSVDEEAEEVRNALQSSAATLVSPTTGTFYYNSLLRQSGGSAYFPSIFGNDFGGPVPNESLLEGIEDGGNGSTACSSKYSSSISSKDGVDVRTLSPLQDASRRSVPSTVPSRHIAGTYAAGSSTPLPPPPRGSDSDEAEAASATVCLVRCYGHGVIPSGWRALLAAMGTKVRDLTVAAAGADVGGEEVPEPPLTFTMALSTADLPQKFNYGTRRKDGGGIAAYAEAVPPTGPAVANNVTLSSSAEVEYFQVDEFLPTAVQMTAEVGHLLHHSPTNMLTGIVTCVGPSERAGFLFEAMRHQRHFVSQYIVTPKGRLEGTCFGPVFVEDD